MITNPILFIFLMLYFTSFVYLPSILDKKTRTGAWDFYGVNYSLLFCFANIFCFLFLNKIRECRKIKYYKDRISHYEQCFILPFGFEYLSENRKKEYLNMKRYLKLKKLK